VHHDADEVARLGPGDYFGERGLLDSAPRNASVTTVEPSTVLRLEGSVLLDALSAAPTIRSAIDRPTGDRAPPTALVDDATWVQP
jgi:CRP-like cAMP-binding protein